MSSIDFHEDEWGRHYSQAPALNRARLGRASSLRQAVVDGVFAFAQTISAYRQRQRYEKMLAEMSPERLRDIFSDAEMPEIPRRASSPVLDGFGRLVG